MIHLKRKILTLIKRPHIAIRKYFRVLILREILPLYYSENYDECWGYVSYKDKIVLDLGADYGSTAYYFLKKKAKKVIAVEGDTKLASKLRDNYETDSRVTCVEKWIKNSKDIEELIKLYPSDLVKVDIEGAEIHITKVSPKVLLLVREWLVEAHTKEICEKLVKLFLELKFRVFAINYSMIGVYRIILAQR